MLISYNVNCDVRVLFNIKWLQHVNYIIFRFQKKFIVQNMGTNVPFKVLDIVLIWTQMIGNVMVHEGLHTIFSVIVTAHIWNTIALSIVIHTSKSPQSTRP